MPTLLPVILFDRSYRLGERVPEGSGKTQKKSDECPETYGSNDIKFTHQVWVYEIYWSFIVLQTLFTRKAVNSLGKKTMARQTPFYMHMNGNR